MTRGYDAVEVTLAARPEGAATESDFRLRKIEVQSPKKGEVRVRNLWMSVDPYMRGRMNAGGNYISPFELGQVLSGAAIGEVVESSSSDLDIGDRVLSNLGWRTMFTAEATLLKRIDAKAVPEQAYLGVMGGPGRSAWLGLCKFAQIVPGDVVFISAAAGAVGQIACQIAKAAGCEVIGSAGGPEKSAYLKELGVDRVLDYRAGQLSGQLRAAAPAGVTVYFDNVGGAHLDAALSNARAFARFVLCGMIGDYDRAAPARTGVLNMFEAVRRNITMRGFIVSQHEDMLKGFEDEMALRIASGSIRWRETVLDGIENAPRALVGLFEGGNIGKMLVRLG